MIKDKTMISSETTSAISAVAISNCHENGATPDETTQSYRDIVKYFRYTVFIIFSDC